MKRYLATAAIVLCFGLLAGCPTPPGEAKKLDCGGSSFVGPLMEEWKNVYLKEKDVEINYARTGSGDGITKMTDKLYAFGCTDAPMSKEQIENAKSQGGEVVHIPVVLGALVPVYNLPGVNEQLHFTGPILADIYLGKITRWNDPALVMLNPVLKDQDKAILPVRRSEKSGSSFIFSSYLSAVSPEWKSKVGAKTELKLEVGEGAKGTDGVTTLVANKEGAIGYVELLYALRTKEKMKDKINFGSVRNKDGKDIVAGPESVTAAADNALKTVPDDLSTISVIDAEGDKSYPICGVVWAVLYVNQPADKGKPTVDFLRWVVHEGQDFAPKLDYARLPDKLVHSIEGKLNAIKLGM